MASRSADITTNPLMPFFNNLSVLSMFASSTLYRSTSWNSVTCSGVDYAYCGMATCRLNGDGRTASCGCKRERDATGRL